MAKETFQRTKPHVNVGSLGCLPIGIIVGLLLVFGVLLFAPAPFVQTTLASFGQARGALGGDSFGASGDFDVGYDPTCPQSAPFRCDEGTCVLTPSMCDPGCPPETPLQCIDGMCVAEPGDCTVFPDCPAVTPYQCADGACEPSLSYCDDPPLTSGCPDGTIMCADGTCVFDPLACPGTPEDHQREVDYFEATYLPGVLDDMDPAAADLVDSATTACQVPGSGGTCHPGAYCCCQACVYVPGYGDLCTDSICWYRPPSGPPPPPPATCPEGWFQCADGTCAVNEAECAVPDVAAPDASGCPADRPFTCDDGTCVATASDCQPPPAEEPPPGGDEPEGCPDGQFQCDDGTCVRTPSACEQPPSPPSGPGDLTSG